MISTKKFSRGWDSSTAPPGKESVLFCRVCTREMTVTRNENAPTSWSESLANIKHLHDTFHCDNAQEGWHKQALALLIRIEDEISLTIIKLLKQEVESILQGRIPTLLKFNQKGDV